MIVRWGLAELPGMLREIGVERPLLVTTPRWAGEDVPAARLFDGVRPHAPLESVRLAIEAAAGADGVVALGGGSAIDTGKAVSATAGIPLVSVPTTYAGAEWTPFFGIRDEERREKGGGGGALLAAAVYEPRLTLSLPRSESGGTALNALAHCAEALYVPNHNEEADRHALTGAGLIDGFLPAVLASGGDLGARTRLLHGAAEAGAALAGSGLALGHAMAQALGGRYAIPHGAANALCLAPALRFNEPVAGAAIARLAAAMGVEDAAARVVELARLSGFTRLRDLGVPEGDIDVLAEATAVRGGARANPRPASPAEIAELFRSIY